MGTFRVLWPSIKDTFDEIFSLVVINLLWVLINAPLMGLAAFLIIEGATVPPTGSRLDGPPPGCWLPEGSGH